MFGPHLLVCGYRASKSALADLEMIYNLIDGLPNLVGMTPITQCQAFRYQGKVKDDWGITAMIMIAESHISIHTFPEKGFFAFDLFSCRDFNTDLVVDTLANAFNLVSVMDMSVQVIHRGREFERGNVDPPEVGGLLYRLHNHPSE
jgi:S-adenosylmethionine decarboxylase